MTETTAATVFRRHKDASFRQFDGEGLLVVPRHQATHVLNGVAAAAFELADGQRNLGAIAEEIGRAFAVPEQAEVVRDLAELFTDLESKGAVERLA